MQAAHWLTWLIMIVPAIITFCADDKIKYIKISVVFLQIRAYWGYMALLNVDDFMKSKDPRNMMFISVMLASQVLMNNHMLI